MKYSHTAKLLRLLALGGTVILTALRVYHLQTAFDKDGLLPPQSAVLLVTVLACAGVFLALSLLCLRLNRLPGSENCFLCEGYWSFPAFGAALLLLIGSALQLDQDFSGRIWELCITLSGLAASMGMVWTAAATRRGKLLFWPRLLLALFSVAALVIRFRAWSHDPMVIHVVPSMLAWVCCAETTMLLSGFSLGAGHRRSSVLFGLSAGVFSCMAMADKLLGQTDSLSETLILLGVSLWCVVSALELLRPQVQEERFVPEAAPNANAADSEADAKTDMNADAGTKADMDAETDVNADMDADAER